VGSTEELFAGIERGDAETIRPLVAGDRAPPEPGTRQASLRSDGFSPLHFAAFFRRPRAAAASIGRGAPVDATGTGWMIGTPLHSAAAGGHVEVAISSWSISSSPAEPTRWLRKTTARRSSTWASRAATPP
jgi:hypothetical protein